MINIPTSPPTQRVHKKHCPLCEKEITYSSKDKLVRALKNNSSCRSCSKTKSELQRDNFTRFCPKCEITLTYSSLTNLRRAEQNKQLCNSCAKSGEANPMYGKIGELNHFFGKRHTEDSKRKLSNSLKGLRSGRNNPMYGRRGELSPKFGKPGPGRGRVGKDSLNWKGGLTTLNKIIRHCESYNLWREHVFIRDNYTCQICKKRGNGTLHADHIKLFSSIIKENSITTYEDAKNCEELWSLDNGRTLCLPCHRERHRNDR